jgi:hypothetical protein
LCPAIASSWRSAAITTAGRGRHWGGSCGSTKPWATPFGWGSAGEGREGSSGRRSVSLSGSAPDPTSGNGIPPPDGVHVGAERGVHVGLVSGALVPEPFQDIPVHSEGDGLLGGGTTTSASSQKSSGRSASSGGDVPAISSSVIPRMRRRSARPRLGVSCFERLLVGFPLTLLAPSGRDDTAHDLEVCMALARVPGEHHRIYACIYVCKRVGVEVPS